MASIKMTAQKLQLVLNQAGVEVVIETEQHYNAKRQKITTYYNIIRYIPDGPDKKKHVLLYSGSLLAEGVQELAELYQAITTQSKPS